MSEPQKYQMFSKLTERENRILERVIKGGIVMAKMTLARMLNTTLVMQGTQSGPLDHFSTKSSGELHVVKTGLMGDIDGACFLILSKAEIENMYEACLPPEVLNDTSAKGKIVKEGFIGELDNIMSASVVTELVDFIDIELYGKVPEIHKIDAEDIQAYLNKEAEQFANTAFVSTYFQGLHVDVKPDFIWMFAENMADQFLK
ncbi:MAG: hypothetical protein JXQ90_08240 [Cyclobacteriaceae bacterium]